MTDLLTLLLALGGGTEPDSSAQALAQEFTQGFTQSFDQAGTAKPVFMATDGEEHTSSPEESAERENAALENAAEPANTAERLAEVLDSLAAAKRSAGQLEETAATERTGQAVEEAVNAWLTAAQAGTLPFGMKFGSAQRVGSGGFSSPISAGMDNISGFQQSAGAPPLERVIVQENQGSSGLSLSALDRMMERDARRYDNGFPLY
jgi:hypothetical protein